MVHLPNLRNNICPVCWRGTLSGGVCSVCHHSASASDHRRADALPLGTVLRNRYVIGEVLGNGGFGITYSVWDGVSQQRLALKELYPRSEVFRAQDRVTVTPMEGREGILSELKVRFEREASLLLQLQGEGNVVNVYDLFSCNGTAYYAMEYLEGCDFQSYLKQYGPVTWAMLEPMMRELLPTIGRLHKHNLIHRDISPDNLFLTIDRHIRLIDFGSVRTYQGNHNFTVHLKDHFAPWEQYISDGKQGPWTDIYALSVTLYMLLCGKLPPKAAERMSGSAVTPLCTLAPAVPTYVAQAIEKGMAVQIEDRFQSAEQFMQALQLTFSQPPMNVYGRGGELREQKKVHTPRIADAFWLVGFSGFFSGQRYLLEADTEILIGRGLECHITFPDQTKGVSRKQCALYLKGDGTVLVRDAGSTYGTLLNGRKLMRTWTLVRQGDVIQFGNECFRFLRQPINR